MSNNRRWFDTPNDYKISMKLESLSFTVRNLKIQLSLFKTSNTFGTWASDSIQRLKMNE